MILPTFVQITAIHDLISHIPRTDVISSSQKFCVVITPSKSTVEECRQLLREHGYHGMQVIRGHFIDGYFIIVPFNI